MGGVALLRISSPVTAATPTQPTSTLNERRGNLDFRLESPSGLATAGILLGDNQSPARSPVTPVRSPVRSPSRQAKTPKDSPLAVGRKIPRPGF